MNNMNNMNNVDNVDNVDKPNKINDLFNIVYVISYKSCSRIEFLENHLKDLSINYKIIYGQVYNEINLDEKLQNNEITRQFYNSFINKNMFKCIKRQIANYDTHYKAWNEFLKSDFDSCMIIEDDNIFIKDYENYLNKNSLPTNYDYIQYGYENFIKNDGGAKDEYYNDFYTKLGWGRAGAHCYVISKRAVKKIIKYSYPQYKGPDGFLGDMCYINKKYSSPFFKKIKIPDYCDKLHNSYISNKKIGYGISQGDEKLYLSTTGDPNHSKNNDYKLIKMLPNNKYVVKINNKEMILTKDEIQNKIFNS